MHTRRELFRLAALAALSPACGAASARPVSTAPPATPFTRFDAELERLMGLHSIAEWNEYTHEAAVAPDEIDRLRAQERTLFDAARPVAEQELARPGISPLDRRRAELWRDGAQGLGLVGDAASVALAQRLEATLDAHVFERNGQRLTRTDVQRLARSADPVERRAAHDLNAGAHAAVVDTARSLLRRRGEAARALGLTSFGDTMLHLRGIEPARWDALSTALEQGTRERYRARLAAGATRLGQRSIAPWDVAYALAADTSWTDALLPAERALDFARESLAALGFDLAHPPVRVVVREFAFGGQTLAIHVPDDVRTVVRPQNGQRFYSTLLHELGHGLQATRTVTREAVFKGYEWVPGLTATGFDEGMAEVLGTLMGEPEFLARFAPSIPAARLAADIRQNDVVFLRANLARVAFERAALLDPDQDLDALERRMDREIRLLDVPDDAPATWANSPFVATYPVYTQSYVLAAMVAAQVHAALRSRFGPRRLSPDAGRLLTETLFARGEEIPWEERISQATGRALSADDLIARLIA